MFEDRALKKIMHVYYKYYIYNKVHFVLIFPIFCDIYHP
jgi:hypothetical protein